MRGYYYQAAQASRKIIFAAQFNTNLSLIGTQDNRTHVYFIMQYDVGIPGLARTVDNFNGRPFQRLSPSDYTMDLYDRKNDSLFYKSFRTVYYSNTNSATPRFTTADAPNPSLVGKLKAVSFIAGKIWQEQKRYMTVLSCLTEMLPAYSLSIN